MYFNKNLLLHDIHDFINRNPHNYLISKEPAIIQHHKSFLLEKILFLEAVLESGGSILINEASLSLSVSLSSPSEGINAQNFSLHQEKLKNFLITNHVENPIIDFDAKYLQTNSLFVDFYKVSFDFILSKLKDSARLYNQNSSSLISQSQQYNSLFFSFIDSIKGLYFKPEYALNDSKKATAFLEKFLLLSEFRTYFEPHKFLVSNFEYVSDNMSLPKIESYNIFLKSISADNMTSVLENISHFKTPEMQEKVLLKIKNIYTNSLMPLTNYSRFSDDEKDLLITYFLNHSTKLKNIDELLLSPLNYAIPLSLVAKGVANYKPHMVFKKTYIQKFENVTITFSTGDIYFKFHNDIPKQEKEALIYLTYNNTLEFFKHKINTQDIITNEDIDSLIHLNHSSILERNLNQILKNIDKPNTKNVKHKI